jgi:antitoxin (DNA-binding transcriptional repressor) of toxin-antitoxin stability system
VKQITIQQLHDETERWVEEAAANGGVVVTRNGSPVAAISQVASTTAGRPLPDREARIAQRTALAVDSAVYLAEMRERGSHER